jgi:hypothetical protein
LEGVEEFDIFVNDAFRLFDSSRGEFVDHMDLMDHMDHMDSVECDRGGLA